MTGTVMTGAVGAQRRGAPLIGLAILAAALRLPFAMTTGLSMDEAGFAVIARAWHRGAVLYSDDAWVDRPQGLIGLYRLLVILGLDTTAGIRGLALLAASLVTIGVVFAARALGADRNAALLSGAAWAVLGAAPAFEGFTANGELLAAVPGVAAIALVARAMVGTSFGRGRIPVIAFGGALAATAILVKQSAIDAAAVTAILVVTIGPRSAQHRLRGLAALIAGAGTIAGLAAAHGASVGWDRYLNAMYRSRLGVAGSGPGAVDGLTRVVVAPGVVVVAAALLSGYGWARWPRQNRSALAVWLLACVVGISAGMLFWAHYFVQLIVPLSVLSGPGIARAFGRDRLRGASHKRRDGGVGHRRGCLVTVVTTLLAVSIWRPSPFGVEIDRRTAVLAQVVADEVPSDETVLGLWQPGAIAFYADRPAGHRYLWGSWFGIHPEEMTLLAQRLASPGRPEWVAEVQPAGMADAALRSGYFVVAEHRGARLWRRNAS